MARLVFVMNEIYSYNVMTPRRCVVARVKLSNRRMKLSGAFVSKGRHLFVRTVTSEFVGASSGWKGVCTQLMRRVVRQLYIWR